MSDRDTRYTEMAAYLWQKLSKDYHLSDYLNEYFENVVEMAEEKLVEPDSEKKKRIAEEHATAVMNIYMHEPMRLAIAQHIYDFMTTSIPPAKNTQQSP